MTISYKIDRELGLVRTTISGALACDDAKEYLDSLSADPNFSTDLAHLIDLCQLTDLPSPKEVRELASILLQRESVSATAKRALLVANDASYGMGRMFEVFSERGPAEYRTFRDEAEALEWLGVSF